ncbi:Uncharacterized protein SCF082_LOCUS45554 [Durusdinium trenchii]|uniref:Uncharacterized protein n=1 Tax=Durusdinium trenchii TaxID=1381693 RepID=A0ABP0R923_9DINO
MGVNEVSHKWCLLDPDLLLRTKRGSDEEESSQGNASLDVTNSFLASYLAGDLDCLDFCLQVSSMQHGQRSFVATAQEKGEICLDEWLQTFRAPAAKKKLQELSGQEYQEDVLGRAFSLLQRLTTNPRQQLERAKPKPKPKPKPKGRRGKNPECENSVVIFADFQEAPHQVYWAKILGQRLVRGTEAAAIDHESVRQVLPETVAKALDGLSPAVRLARAAARSAQRGLWLDASMELRHLWAFSTLEPCAAQGALSRGGRHLGFVIRCAARKVLADEGASPSSADQEETLLLALLFAEELGRQRRILAKADRAAVPLQEGDPTLLEVLQTKSLLLSLAAVMQLLDREVVTRADEVCAVAFWQRLASALLSAVWHLVDQAFGESLLRLQLAELARVVGLAPPCRDCDEMDVPLELRAAAVASGSHTAHLGKRLVRPKRVPAEGLVELLPDEDDSKGLSSVRARSRDKLQSDDGASRAQEVLEQVSSSLEEMVKTSAASAPMALLKSTLLYGAPFLADRLTQEYPICEETSKRLISQLRAALLEVGSRTEVEAGHEAPRRRNQQIGGNVVLEAEIREVRRSWNPEMEVQWFDLLRFSADSEDTEDELSDKSDDGMP